MKFWSSSLSLSWSKTWRYWLPCLLACVLWTQLLGISHRYAHPFGNPAATQQLSQSALQQTTARSSAGLWWDVRNPLDESNLHSCLLFDAASCADQIATLAELILPDLPIAQTAIDLPIHNWCALPELAFLSRAPPILA